MSYSNEVFYDEMGRILVLFIVAVFTLWIVMKNRNKIIRNSTTPIQRAGLVMVCLGVTMFVSAFCYYMGFNLYKWGFIGWSLSNYINDVTHRHEAVYFNNAMAWYGIIITFVGVWLAWIHESTTAKLFNWIKNGS
jgi:hypothetical protein